MTVEAFDDFPDDLLKLLPPECFRVFTVKQLRAFGWTLDRLTFLGSSTTHYLCNARRFVQRSGMVSHLISKPSHESPSGHTSAQA